MTLNELIDLLRRQRAAHPELADAPALVVIDVVEHDGSQESYEDYVPAVDVWASTQGVVVAPRVMRGTSPQAPACDDEHVHRYENSQGAVTKPARHSLRDCERELTALVPNYAQAQDGLTFDCSCGRRFAHVCDEAEGCRWDVIRGLPAVRKLQRPRNRHRVVRPGR